MSATYQGTRACSCGASVLVGGAPKVAHSANGWAEHFADHACVAWFPRSRRLMFAQAECTRAAVSESHWARMVYLLRAWNARVAARGRS